MDVPAGPSPRLVGMEQADGVPVMRRQIAPSGHPHAEKVYRMHSPGDRRNTQKSADRLRSRTSDPAADHACDRLDGSVILC